MLFENKANLDPKSQNERTPLHIACLRGSVSAAVFLVEKGANPNCQDMYLYTPLHYASQYGMAEIIELLLQHPQIDVNITNNVGLKAHEIAVNIESWEIFEKYSATDGGGGYGRTVFRDNVRHSD